MTTSQVPSGLRVEAVPSTPSSTPTPPSSPRDTPAPVPPVPAPAPSPAPAPTVQLLPVTSATVDLGTITINGVEYRMMGHNWPTGTSLDEAEKKALGEVLKTQLEECEGSLDKAVVRFNPEGLEVAQDSQPKRSFHTPLAQRIAQSVRAFLNQKDSTPTITFSAMHQQVQQAAAKVQTPPAILWGWNNCYWASILWVYLLNPLVQTALLRSIEAGSTPAQSVALSDVIRGLQKNPTAPVEADAAKQMLQAILKSEDTSSQRISGQVEAGVTQEVREVWARLRAIGLLSVDAIAEQEEARISTLPSISLPSDSEDIPSIVGDHPPDILDLKIEDREAGRSSVIPPLAFKAKDKSYTLQGLIIHTPGHYISIVRKRDEMGILHTFLCDNGPGQSADPIKKITREEYRKLLSQPGHTAVQALYGVDDACPAPPDSKPKELDKEAAPSFKVDDLD